MLLTKTSRGWWSSVMTTSWVNEHGWDGWCSSFMKWKHSNRNDKKNHVYIRRLRHVRERKIPMKTYKPNIMVNLKELNHHIQELWGLEDIELCVCPKNSTWIHIIVHWVTWLLYQKRWMNHYQKNQNKVKKRRVFK